MTAVTKSQVPGDDTDYEQWENATASRICLKFYNQQGILTDRIIDSFRKFQITPKERQLNQEMAAGPDLDCFSNGRLAPVRLIESADDVEKIRANPNTMTDDEMKALLANRRATKAFEERIEAITNPYALTRLLELANADETTTAKQVKTIEERLNTVSPSSFNEIQAFPGAVTTRELGR